MTLERRLLLHGDAPRFWHLVVEDAVITLRSGLAGTPGVVSRIPCPSSAAAAKTAEALVGQRLRDGFVEASEGLSGRVFVLDASTEAQLLEDDLDRWLVLADAMMETQESVRGELVALQVRAARGVRGAVGQSQRFLRQHFDELVGEVAAFHKQVFLDWRFGYVRTARIWSGPHSAPIADVLPALLASPACRFLERLELGSPGAEGRYDVALRKLAKLSWPPHLHALFLGNFDVALAQRTRSAWPRLDSLNALQPVADRLHSLEVRGMLNTLGRGLSFPHLQRLALSPMVLDARVVSDLATVDAPELKTLTLTQIAPPTVGREAWATALRKRLALGVRELGLHRVSQAVELLALVGEPLRRLEVLDLRDSVTLRDDDGLLALAPHASQARLELGDAPTLKKRLARAYPKLGNEPNQVEDGPNRATPKRRASTE